MKQTIIIAVPKQLELLFQLLETTPQKVIQGFISDLALEVHYSNGSDERRMAFEYFLRVGYGMHRYSFDQVGMMFDGLNWLRQEWPGNDPEKEKQYQRQRRAFLKQWFKEWKEQQKDL